MSTNDLDAGAPVQQQQIQPIDESWKRVWSLSEMRDSSRQWTLASDAGLLNFMQDFANRLINQTKELENHVDSLVHDVKSTHVKVHNTFDQFLMLSHSQFIENRVYEDNSEVEKTGEVEAATSANEVKPEITEEILIPKFTSAIQLGLSALEKSNLMNNAMEVSESSGSTIVDGNNIDAMLAEGERPPQDENQQPKKEKLDHYLRYPLPHIIGSQQFKEDDYCGLFIEESDTESSDVSESESESESEDEEVPQQQGEFENNPDGSLSLPADQRPPVLMDPSTSFLQPDSSASGSLFQEDDSSSFNNKKEESGNLFDDDIFTSAPSSKPKSFTTSLSDILGEDDGDLFTEKPTAAPKEKNAFQDELASAIGGAPKKTKSDDDGLLFDDTPAPTKSKSKSLFDDDLFGDSSSETTIKSTTAKKSVTFDDSMFGDEPAAPKKTTTSTSSTGKKSLSDLFSDESMFGDDTPAPTTSTKKKSISFLDDDDDDLFATKPKSKPAEAAKPKATNPLLDDGDLPTVTPAASKPSVSSSDTEKTATDEESTPAAPKAKKPVGGVKLFDFGGDDDILSSVTRKKDLTPTKPATSEPTKQTDSDSDLFGGLSNKKTETKKDITSDILGIEGDLMDKPVLPVKKHRAKTFDDSSDVLGLGSATTKTTAAPKTEPKKTISEDFFNLGSADDILKAPPKIEEAKPAESTTIESKPAAKKSFFDDDPLLAPPKKKEETKPAVEAPIPTPVIEEKPSTESKPAAKKNFFDDDDPLVAPPKKKEETKPAAAVVEPIGSSVDSPLGIIPTATSTPSAATTTSKPTKSSFFDDINDNPLNANQKADVKATPSVSKPSKSSFFDDIDDGPLKPKAETKTTSTADSLFGGSDSLFGNATISKPAEKKSTTTTSPPAAAVETFDPLNPSASASAPAAKPSSKDFFNDLDNHKPSKASESLFGDTKPAVSTKPNKDFFSDFDEKPTKLANKDDIFEVPVLAAVEKPTPTPAPVSTTAPAKNTTQPPAPKKDSLFDDSLSLGITKNKSPLEDAKSSGGLFGDVDSSLSISKPREGRAKTVGSIFEAQQQQAAKEKEDAAAAAAQGPSGKKAPSGKIGALLGVLALDPSKMAPGAAPPRKKKIETDEENDNTASEKSDTDESGRESTVTIPSRARSGSESRPRSSTTSSSDEADSKLTHVTKGRPKSAGRRPPSRKPSSVLTDDSTPSTTPSPSTTSPTISTKSSEPSIFDSIPSTSSPITTKKDTTTETSSTTKSTSNGVKSPLSLDDDLIIPTKSTKSTNTTKSTTATTTTKNTTPDSIFDDIPVVPVTKKTKPAATTKKAAASTKKDNATSLFDDITPTTTTKSTSATKKKTAADDLFDDAKPTTTTPKPKTTKTKKAAANVDSLFD